MCGLHVDVGEDMSGIWPMWDGEEEISDSRGIAQNLLVLGGSQHLPEPVTSFGTQVWKAVTQCY